ncbi:MAG: WbqC family protein [Tetrasphaera sp.]|nr:WbqC family protein [Tetrasphaera sp.]
MRVAIHQPDLLPYSGFWFKMATSDAFVLAVHDQFQKHGYQRRVRMRGTWVSHQLVGKPALVPITQVQVQPGWQGRLIDAIRGRYTGARHFRTRGTELLERIEGASGASLVEVNTALIEVIRDLLGITTPLLRTHPRSAPASSGSSRSSGPSGVTPTSRVPAARRTSARTRRSGSPTRASPSNGPGTR